MSAGSESTAGDIAARWVSAVCRRSGRVSLAIGAITLAGLVYTLLALGINTDTTSLVDPDLPFQVRDREFRESFHTLTDSMLIVIDSETPGAARRAADEIALRLETSDHFTRVRIPGGGEFFEEHGLLYRSIEELEDFGDQLAELQPVLVPLSESPTLASLSGVIELALSEGLVDAQDTADLPTVLDSFGEATVSVYSEHPISVGWETVLLSGSAFDPTTRWVVVADPVLATDAFLAAAPAMNAIAEASAAAGIDADPDVTLRVTGYPALNYEEMLGLVFDVGIAGFVSFLFILGLLYVALHSTRVVLAAATTLVCGLFWTSAFAAAAIGSLNVTSIAFAVLFLGLGVDFSIHLGLHYTEARRTGEGHEEALDGAVRSIGYALVVCTVTTAIGFYVFVPTDYQATAELGLISGTGMVVILFLTLTLFPALLTAWCRDRTWIQGLPENRLASRLADFGERRAVAVCVVAIAVGIAAVPLAARVRFDSNVVTIRNPETPSVKTFDDLLGDAATSPWYVDLVAPDLRSAAELAVSVEANPLVDDAVTLLDYVPSDQDEKLDILGDLAFLLEPTGGASDGDDRTPEAQVEALHDLLETLALPWIDEGQSPLARSALMLRERLSGFLEKLEGDPEPEASLATLEKSMLGKLPERLDTLRRALEPEPVELESLPAELVSRLRADDDRTRVQVFPTEDLSDDRALARFVASIRQDHPDATGLPVNIVEFGSATASSLREAFGWAIGLIGALLLLLWRRLSEVLLVMLPLLLGAAVTVALMVLLDWPFNFVNVVVLPLLLGIGVDSGIHLVNRARSGHHGSGLVETTAARAVLFSALTTMISFSSLATSGHRGIASLGALLFAGMGAMLLCMLVVLPSLLHATERLRGRSA